MYARVCLNIYLHGVIVLFCGDLLHFVTFACIVFVVLPFSGYNLNWTWAALETKTKTKNKSNGELKATKKTTIIITTIL